MEWSSHSISRPWLSFFSPVSGFSNYIYSAFFHDHARSKGHSFSYSIGAAVHHCIKHPSTLGKPNSITHLGDENKQRGSAAQRLAKWVMACRLWVSNSETDNWIQKSHSGNQLSWPHNSKTPRTIISPGGCFERVLSLTAFQAWINMTDESDHKHPNVREVWEIGSQTTFLSTKIRAIISLVQVFGEKIEYCLLPRLAGAVLLIELHKKSLSMTPDK